MGLRAVAWGDSHREVFALGTDLRLWHDWSDDNFSWSGWYSLGGPNAGLCSASSAVSWGPGRMDVFAMGCDYALWHIWFEDRWSGWENLGGVINSTPSAVSAGFGRLDVLVNDFAGCVWDRLWDGSSWT